MPDSDRRVLAGVLALSAVALLARVVALGARVTHWDESRVGYWILRYAATGEYTYRAGLGGPFLVHANRLVFDLVGASDASLRVVVALCGGLLPLTAWLFRERLRPAETVSLAAVLALNPLLLYYSRFARPTVLLAAFAFAAFAFFVRARETGARRHAYAGVIALALAFATTRVVLVYVLAWGLAAVLALDPFLLRARVRGESRAEALVARLDAVHRGLRSWGADVAGGAALFLAVLGLAYAPRPDLWRALGDPARLPELVRATGHLIRTSLDTSAWEHSHSYVEFLRGDLSALAAGAAVVCALGVAGFLVDRYGEGGPRPLVSFAGYWTLVALVVLPIVPSVQVPWTMAHVVVALALPAAVGAGRLVALGASALRDGDRVSGAVAGVVALCVVGWVVASGASAAFVHPQSGPLVEYGQPSGNLDAPLADAETAIAANDGGTDVLYYGEHFHATTTPSNAPGASFYEPKHWLWRMPLPWYFERMGADTTSATSPSALDGETPPVVVTLAKNYGEVNSRLDGYHASAYRLTQTDTATVFFVRNETA
ncbi:MAG: flippase activity-associated protein Agl23 [Halarchaeum sp.]